MEGKAYLMYLLINYLLLNIKARDSLARLRQILAQKLHDHSIDQCKGNCLRPTQWYRIT